MTAPGIVIFVLLIFALVVIPPEVPPASVIEDAVKDQINHRDT